MEAAIHFVGVVPFHFNLNRRVINSMMMFQFFDDGLKDLLTFTNGLLVNKDMATAGHRARSDRPNVKIMDIQDTINRRNAVLNRVHIHTERRPLQQDVDAFFEYAPGTPEDQSGNQD